MTKNKTKLIATESEIKEFNIKYSENRHIKIDESILGVLAETASTGNIRYEWNILRPLVYAQLTKVLTDYEAEESIEIGPVKPLPSYITLKEWLSQFSQLLKNYDEPPFTYQRLCELLLEPKKQYNRLEKLINAIDILLSVDITIPYQKLNNSLPEISKFTRINEVPIKSNLQKKEVLVGIFQDCVDFHINDKDIFKYDESHDGDNKLDLDDTWETPASTSLVSSLLTFNPTPNV